MQATVISDITSSVKKGLVYAKAGDKVEVIKVEGDLTLIQTAKTKIYTKTDNLKIQKQ